MGKYLLEQITENQIKGIFKITAYEEIILREFEQM